MLCASLHHAAWTLMPRNVSQLFVTTWNLANLDSASFSSISFCFHFRLSSTFTARAMLLPKLINILVTPHLDSFLTNGADYDIKLISITTDTASVVIWSSMVTTVDFFTVLALKRHEISLVTFWQLAVLSYLCFKHFYYSSS